eukprot:352476-Chlamydomonas_euryale.AAC.2
MDHIRIQSSHSKDSVSGSGFRAWRSFRVWCIALHAQGGGAGDSALQLGTIDMAAGCSRFQRPNAALLLAQAVKSRKSTGRASCIRRRTSAATSINPTPAQSKLRSTSQAARPHLPICACPHMRHTLSRRVSLQSLSVCVLPRLSPFTHPFSRNTHTCSRRMYVRTPIARLTPHLQQVYERRPSRSMARGRSLRPALHTLFVPPTLPVVPHLQQARELGVAVRHVAALSVDES